MIDYHAPQRAEAFLMALGADESLTNDVLGDLAEEFAERVTWQGRSQARWWYYRQVVTVTPLFLRDWRSNARTGDFESLAVSVVWSTLAAQALAITLYTVIDRLTYLFTDVPFGTWMRHFAGIESPLAWVIGWGFTAAVSFGAGFIASRFGKRAPMPALLASLGTWTMMYFGFGGSRALTAPGVIGFASFAAIALAGGLLGIPGAIRRPALPLTGVSS